MSIAVNINEPKASIVIPNWNGEKLLEDCLKSLLNSNYKYFEVIVVDNKSTDNSSRLIKDKYPQVKLIELEYNTGFASAVNVGIKQSKGDFIVLLNNDTEVTPNWLTNILQPFDRDQSIGIVTSKLLNFFNREIIDSAGDVMNIVGQAKSRGYGVSDKENYTKSEFVFLATGGASAYKKELFKEVGLFEETFFMYFEDADLSFRAQKKGFKVWYEHSAVLYHHHRASSNKRKSLLEYLLYRNFMIFYLINTPVNLMLRRGSLVKFILVSVHTLIYLSAKGYTKEAVKAMIWVISHPIMLIKMHRDRSKNIEISENYIDSYREDKKLKILGLNL
jgi:GT2 family glycosyltransferase